MIREYLDMLLPEDWARLDVGARRRFIHNSEFGETQEGTVKRDKVCAMEVWLELFQGDPRPMIQAQAREINDILRKIEGWEVHSNANGMLRFGILYGLQRAYVRKNLIEA